MLIVRYGGEAERKRLEYVLERFKDRVKTVKPGGSVVLIDGDREDVKFLLEELFSRLPRENVALYKLSEPDVEVEERRRVLEVEARSPVEEVWGAISLIMARLKGSLVSEVRGSREYVVRPRGGYARVRIHVSPVSGGGSLVRVVVEGYGSGFDRVVSGLVDELGLLGVVRRVE